MDAQNDVVVAKKKPRTEMYTKNEREAHEAAHKKFGQRNYNKNAPRIPTQGLVWPRTQVVRNEELFESLAKGKAEKLITGARAMYASGYLPTFWRSLGCIGVTGFSEIALCERVQELVDKELGRLGYKGRVTIKQHPRKTVPVLHIKIDEPAR